LVDLVEKGIPVAVESIFTQSDVHSLFGDIHGVRVKNLDIDVKSHSSPISIYFKVYSFVMANQDAFIHRLKQS